jgi:membrane-anchored protein YejM (alkaline phosphatase superfamily)
MMARRDLLRWIGWFGVVNTALFCVVGLRYLLVYQFPGDTAGIVYAVLAFIGQSAVLAVIPLFLFTAPVVLLIPRRRWVMSVGVLIASIALSLLLLDTQVFVQYRFHLSRLTMELFQRSTWVFAGIFVLILLFFQSLLAGIVWRNRVVADHRHQGPWVAVLLVGSWLGGTGIHIWGDAVAYTPVMQFTRFLPLYYPIHAKRDLARLGWIDPEEVRRRRLIEGSMDSTEGQLTYPIKPLSCDVNPDERLNILVLLIDALRPDAIHPQLTPQLAGFRDRALNFQNHFSGGNSSRMGLFSFFYGLPTTYWRSFYDLQRPPVLMDEIRRAGYELALFSAIGFGSPTLIDRTVFAGEVDLPEEDASLTATARNIAVTDDWLAWLDGERARSPFFAFLYYDPPMGEMPESGGALPMDERFTTNKDAVKRWRQYRLAARLIDGEVGRVLHSLTQHELLDNTVVLVISDHGYEFDDNGLGYIGHAGNFSEAQLRSTFLVHWPGKPATAITYRTSHHDVAVTLLQDAFGCTNPIQDYAVGRNLFSGESWDWIMAGSYNAHAIVQPDQVIVSNPGGFVEILGKDYRPLDDSQLDASLIRESMMEMRRFYP